MRIISQDGTVDVPYELALISIYINAREEYNIYAQGTFVGVNADDNFMVMATYSTEVQARKVMKMLRNEYRIYKIEETYHDRTEYYNPVFQFPQDIKK